MENLEDILRSYSFTVVGFASALLLGLTIISLKLKHQSKNVKVILFGSILAVCILPTLFLAGSTIYLNTISSSNGPVHWHADFEIWACGNKVNLRDPKGLSNKIGTATLHEHSDERIHLEGVVIEPHDASLGKFFQVIGAEMRYDMLSVPVNEGMMMMQNGVTCGDGMYREVQYFVYQTDKEGYYSQQKLTDPASYIISPTGTVPPGDCIIVELDIPKDRTEKLCRSYQVAEKIGKLKGER